MPYKEIKFVSDPLNVIDRLANSGVNIASVNISDEGRIVIEAKDLSIVLNLIPGPICVSDVELYPIQDHPGSLRDLIKSLSMDNRVVKGLYTAENNMVVFRYQNLC